MLETQLENIIPETSSHLLFVDDEASLGELLVEFFTQKNFTAANVICANEAFQYLDKNQVDVVISNINMPGMNGIDMTEIIRKNYDAKVIIFTGYGSLENRKNAFRKGAHAYLTKPAPIEHLYKLVHRLTKEDVVYIG